MAETTKKAVAKKTTAKKAASSNPFSTVPDPDEAAAADEQGATDEGAGESLGDMASAKAGESASSAGSQETLEGTEYTKIKFVGMSFDTLDTDVKIGDEMEFIVRGRVKGVADEEDSKGNVNHVAKVKVSSVTPRPAR